MFDVEIHLMDQPGQLARTGEALGAAGVSVEGGGMWLVGSAGVSGGSSVGGESSVGDRSVGVAHFLVADGERATAALLDAGMTVAGCREVVVQRLDQDVPGQLGAFCRALADAEVNIEVLYSDHDNQLVVAVDNLDAARSVSAAWMAGRSN